MKSLIRENPTIAFGLGLPLVLVVVFLLASGIPVLLVAPPQYDVIYATDYYNYQQGVQISVVDQKVHVTYQGPAQNIRTPRLWRYDAETGAVQEIPIIVPPDLLRAENNEAAAEAGPETTVLKVPQLEGVTVDPSSIAPDGYEFRLGRERFTGNIFGELFYPSRYRHEAVLTKDGRSIRLPYAAERYYTSNTRFIGWVVSS